MVRVVGDDTVEYADEGVVAAGMEKDARYWEEGTTRCAGLKSTAGKDTSIVGCEREGQTVDHGQWDASQSLCTWSCNVAVLTRCRNFP